MVQWNKPTSARASSDIESSQRCYVSLKVGGCLINYEFWILILNYWDLKQVSAQDNNVKFSNLDFELARTYSRFIFIISYHVRTHQPYYLSSLRYGIKPTLLPYSEKKPVAVWLIMNFELISAHSKNEGARLQCEIL